MTTSPRCRSRCSRASGRSRPTTRSPACSSWPGSRPRRAACRRSRSPSTSTRTGASTSPPRTSGPARSSRCRSPAGPRWARTAVSGGEAEVRNRADTLAYATEKFVAENADKSPADVKAEVESAIADLKRALEGTDIEAIKEATEKAAQVSQKMGTAIYAQSQASASAGGASDGGSASEEPADDDVVEAEIVDDEKPAEGGAA